VGRIIERKLAAMRRMDELLADVPEIIRPAGIARGHGAHLYVIRIDSTKVGSRRDELQAELKNKYKIGTAVHYPPVWSWEAFAEIEHDRGACPVAERACADVLTLPVFATSGEEDLTYVAWALKQVFSR
jgi:dTDP-4-amino-4,6-dideoxygalactose transaminase